MKKLSVLLFSRNKVEAILRLINEIYDLADEVVLVDSSDRRERKEIAKAKIRRNWTKLRIFYMIPTGLVETARPYGLLKCRNDWVLYLDADEEISENFKNDIGKIIADPRYDAFNIKRYEGVLKGQITPSLYTWNIRLFRKSHVHYKGIIHEQPIVNGKLGVLDDRYYIMNTVEYKDLLTGREYSKLNKLERMSYKAYNELFLDYLKKLFMPNVANINLTITGRLILSFLRVYEIIGLKKEAQELSDFDYFMYNVIKHSVISFKERDLNMLLETFSASSKYVNKIKGWKSESDSREIFEIAKIMYDEGIIRLVGFDKERVIKKLNKKYKDREIRGADLLLSLLKESYNRSRGLLKNAGSDRTPSLQKQYIQSSRKI